MQNQYNLLYREEEREMIAYCKFNGIGLISWGPLSSGRLARPVDASSQRAEHINTVGCNNRTDEWQAEIIGRVQKLSKKKGWSMAQVGLTWINTKITSPIVGISSVRLVFLRGMQGN
jgi:aryl-alcohol dehydrogenase-like predicted oxidoreductase